MLLLACVFSTPQYEAVLLHGLQRQGHLEGRREENCKLFWVKEIEQVGGALRIPQGKGIGGPFDVCSCPRLEGYSSLKASQVVW